MPEVLAAFVSVKPPSGSLHVVIPVRVQDKNVMRAMATLGQLCNWLKERTDVEEAYQDILERLLDVPEETPVTIQMERLG